MSKRRRNLGDDVPKDDWDDIIARAPKLTKWQNFKGDAKNLGLEMKEFYDSFSDLDKMNIKASLDQIKNYAEDSSSENINEVVDNALDAIGLAGPEGKIASTAIKMGLPFLDDTLRKKGVLSEGQTAVGSAWAGIQHLFQGKPWLTQEWLDKDQTNQNKWLDERILNPSLLDSIEFEGELEGAKKLIEERKKTPMGRILLKQLELNKKYDETVANINAQILENKATTEGLQTNAPVLVTLEEKPMLPTAPAQNFLNPGYKRY